MARLAASGQVPHNGRVPSDPAAAFSRLKQRFVKEIGVRFPAALEPDPAREPLSAESTDLLAFSEAISGRLPLPSVDGFEGAPLGTWLAGFWGYGVNSYAFYFARKDERREVYLRLAYGGVYGKPLGDARQAREFIDRYLGFEDWASPRARRWSVLSDMGGGLVRLELNDGTRGKYFDDGGGFRFPNEGARPM